MCENVDCIGAREVDCSLGGDSIVGMPDGGNGESR